jgi:23S rRNA (uridine2552-2'-O)-methyltransferase
MEKKGSGRAGGRGLTVRVETRAKRSISSANWLERQLNDPYVAEARRQGFRSRAAFKLLQLDERFHLLKSGMKVADLGAAPGGWLQVTAPRIKALEGKGRLVGIDLLAIDRVDGATLIQGDMLEEKAGAQVKVALGGPADLVLSDMAAVTTGHRPTDHIRTLALAETAFEFACEILAPGGAFVVKLFQGGAEKELLNAIKQRFATVKHAKPEASRAESSELYMVAQGFRGQ